MAGVVSMHALYVPAHSETLNVAASLAETGTYADAYGPGVGSTAHCTPLLPLLISALFRVFGVYTPASAVAMHAAASFASALAFALLPLLAAASGLPLRCGILAGLAGELLPLIFWFQVYASEDAPFTAAVLVGLFILICRIRARGQFTGRDGVLLGISAGLGCLLSPAILPAILGCVIVFAVQHRRRLRRMIVFSAPPAYVLRQRSRRGRSATTKFLGAPIWTRSNFWMEFNLSNNDLLTADEQRNFLMPAFARMHPTESPVERAKVRRLGEVAYNRAKRKQVLARISTHKRRFLELTADRFRLFWIPRMKRPLQSIGEAAVTILALTGLALLFRSRRKSAWIFAALVVLYPAVCYLIMVTPRFRLPLEPFLFLLAGYCCYRLLMRLAGSRFNTVYVRR